jgi:hypothetical protein
MVEQHDIYVKAAAFTNWYMVDIKANAIYWDAVSKAV